MTADPSIQLDQDDRTDSWLDLVRQKAEAIRFGSVLIVLHEGRVTQVECTEKTRLPSEPVLAGDRK